MPTQAATDFLKFIKHRPDRRSVAFLACLILAGVFWLLTSLSDVYVTRITVPVTYGTPPEHLLITNRPQSKLTAEVKGHGFNLLWYWLRFEHLEVPVKADPDHLPSILRRGERYHYVLIPDDPSVIAGLDEDPLELLSLTPDTLFIRLENKRVKRVPVRLRAEMSFSKQFGMTDHPMLDPDSIWISGPVALVDSITFVPTEMQQWTDLKGNVAAEVRLDLPESSELISFEQQTVQVQLNVVEFTEGRAMVPLNIVSNAPQSVRLFPAQVEIKYQVPLSEFETVTPEQFQASVRLTEANKGVPRLTVYLDDQPETVRQVRVNPLQVEFIIQK